MPPSNHYEQVIESLRHAYDAKADERDSVDKDPWKLAERAHFLALLQAEGRQTLLEIGAGTGQDSLFFQQNGLDVTSTDLSAQNVERCRAKGLTAHQMDFLHLDFPDASFDAVYALNCLLHVPKADLPSVLEAIRRLLKPDGLFFMGVYGGPDHEGTLPEDRYEPKRLFVSYTDAAIQKAVAQHFEIVSFKAIPLGDDPLHFQSIILRRP